MTIRRLPTDIASKIAAGEVIERPASIVKELIENSLDANAKRVGIDVTSGGLDSIRVVDDGHGIPSNEVEIALQRHSTSKLRTLEDLSRIKTLGFRGEALASIAAVAEVTLSSVTDVGIPGISVTASDDTLMESMPYGGSVGTQVSVRNLFHRLPARRKFLRGERTELGHIVDVVTHIAIGHPQVAFVLSDGRQEQVRTPGNGDVRTTLMAIYGAEVVKDLIELPSDPISGIYGFVSQPRLQRSSRRDISFYVNRRWVGDRVLIGAISDAYQGFLPSRRFPMVVLWIGMPAEDVDVNVHPAKAEVRFRRSGEVFRRVSATVRRELGKKGTVAPARVDQPVIDQFYLPTTDVSWSKKSVSPPRGLVDGDLRQSAEAADGDNGGTSSAMPRALGQIDNTYIVAVSQQGIYLVDQHAAHERVIYEQLGGPAKSNMQALLDPVPVMLPAASSEWVADHVEELAALGLDLEPFGATTWLVRGVPSTGRPIDPSVYVCTVVEEACESPTGRRVVTEQLRWSAACHAAVKAGEQLAIGEMQSLLGSLEDCDLGLTCPHGRPTMVLLTKEMLDRQFGRL